MIVEKITLKNFRNHTYSSFDFQKGINIFTGPNGSGKTNVVESIYYLSLGRSFRTQDDNDLIQYGKDKAEIIAKVKEGNISRQIRVIFAKQGRVILINDKPIKKVSELSQLMNVLLFEPRDVDLFRGSPKERRSFLDINISKKSQPYLESISRYNKILKQRNDILKQENVDLSLLEVTTDLLIETSKPIVEAREAYLKDINDILIKITRALTGVNNEIEIHYSPYVKSGESFTESAKNAFNQALEGDLKRKATSIGVHREDFSITLNGRDIATFGSQGENRIVALSLLLCPYFLIKEVDKRPVVVLDDVMSELDQSHRLRLIQFVQKLEQVFITATRLEVKDAVQYQLKVK